VAFVVVCGAMRVVRTLRSRQFTSSEDEFAESNLFAPSSLFATRLEKKLVAEYAQVGDLSLLHQGPRDSSPEDDR
jgi:carbon starvation protein